MHNNNKICLTIVYGIALVLFILPFFWFLPSEIEFGGDSSRLYLYDPDAYLKINVLYSVEPEGLGKSRADQSLLPLMLVFKVVNDIFRSPYILMSLLNSIKLAVSFISIYLIINELLRREHKNEAGHLQHTASILAGLFYTLSPAIGENLKTALLTHNQVFLNPLIFYLLLRFIHSQKESYLWRAILLTVIFASNFSLTAPPPFFSFYPLVFLFLILYAYIFLKQKIIWKSVGKAMLLFIGLHSFHFIPEIINIVDSSSLINARLFNQIINKNEGLEYFNAIAQYGKVISNMFIIHAGQKQVWISFITPLISLLGCVVYYKRKKVLPLIIVFYLITLFLMSANITSLGLFLYRIAISFPAFSMFRNFYGQFQWVYMFFYSLFFGVSVYYVLRLLKFRYVLILSGILFSVFIYTGLPYLSGSIFYKPTFSSKEMTSVVRMDPDYVKALQHISSLVDDSKIINFPFTDFSYQVVSGTNNGAYIGPSMISYLAGMRNFSGYQNIYPFHGVFFELINKKDYDGLRKLFGLLNIRYIFVSENPKAYVEYFPTLPFSHLKKSLPDTSSLVSFVKNLSYEKVFDQGYYKLYKTSDTEYLPHIYIPQNISVYDGKENPSFFLPAKDNTIKDGYIERTDCNKIYSLSECDGDIVQHTKISPSIRFNRINPTKYIVEVANATSPYVLVLSDQFHNHWRVYKKDTEFIDSSLSNSGSISILMSKRNIFYYKQMFETLRLKEVSINNHFMINGYANAWLINDVVTQSSLPQVFIIEMVDQRMVYVGILTSLIVGVIFLCYGYRLYKSTCYEK